MHCDAYWAQCSCALAPHGTLWTRRLESLILESGVNGVDLVKLAGGIIAISFFVAYVLTNNVPAHINSYLNQPVQIVNKVYSMVPTNISPLSFNVDFSNLTKLGHVSGNFTVEVPQFYHNLNGSLKVKVPQVPTRVSGHLSVNVSSVTYQGVYLEVHNDMNLSVAIENVTGDYVYLPSVQVVGPESEGAFLVRVTNFTGFYELYKQGKEVVTLYLDVEGVSFSTEVNLSEGSNVSLSVPNYGGGTVSVEVTNTLPVNVTIENVTGSYIYLLSPLTVGSNSTATARFYVTNYTGFYELYNQSKEIVDVSLEIGGLQVEERVPLTENVNLSVPNTLGGTVEVKVFNPFNFSVVLYKAYGEYFQLVKPQTLPPGYSLLKFNVTNFYLLYENIEKKVENVTVVVGIGNVNVTKTFPLGGSASLAYYGGGVVSVAVSNPLSTQIVIYNLTGEDLYLLNKTVVGPHRTGVLRIYVKNFTDVLNEDVTVFAEVYGVNLTSTFRITKSLSVVLGQVFVPVHNPFNESVVIYNITGKYLYLTREYVIPPGATLLLEIKVLNQSEVFNENITVYARIGETNITYVVRL